MKSGIKYALMALSVAALTLSVALAAEADAPKSLKDLDYPGLQEKVMLNALDPWDVVQLIDYLALKGGLKNLVVSKGVSGLTTKLKFDNIPVGDALEVVLSVNNLAYVVKNGIITILTDAEYQVQYGVGFYDHKRVKVINLKYADPARVSSMLAPIKSAMGTIVYDGLSGTMIMIDTPEKLAAMEAIIQRTDIQTINRIVPTETRLFVLQYANVEDILKEVTPLISADVGSVRTDARTRTLIVTDLPHKVEKVNELITAFDKRSKEVFIEAKVVQVSLSDEYRLGIDWNHLFQGVDPRFSLSSKVSPPLLGARGTTTAAGAGFGSLTYNTIVAGGNLRIILDALKSVGDTRILSNPHVAVMDGSEATIKVVRDEPYAEAQIESGTTNVVGETFKFIEVGVSLAVRPRINDEGMIAVAIKPTVSSVEGTYQARYSVPIVQKAFAETSVMIRDGETIIIAGMIEDSKGKRNAAVPFLHRIPLLGMLFRSQSDLSQVKETIVFLTPRIITGEEPVQLLRDMKKKPKALRATGMPDAKEMKPVR